MSTGKATRASGRATISDVASIAKTGKTSVSRYLNGEQHLLSDDLKQRIEQAIQQLDYRPSQMARSLKGGQTRLIGLILADITNPYSVDVMRGIEAACRQHGFTLLVCNTNNEVNQNSTTCSCSAVTGWKASWSTRSACARKRYPHCNSRCCQWC